MSQLQLVIILKDGDLWMGEGKDSKMMTAGDQRIHSYLISPSQRYVASLKLGAFVETVEGCHSNYILEVFDLKTGKRQSELEFGEGVLEKWEGDDAVLLKRFSAGKFDSLYKHELKSKKQKK